MWWLLPLALAETRVPEVDLPVYTSPTTAAPYRGLLAHGQPFEVVARVAGRGCPGEGWGELAGHGYACLARTAPTDAPAAPLDGALFGDLPFVYGKRTGGRSGAVYASAAAWERGDAPVAHVPREETWHFVAVQTTTRGEVYVRDDGRVVPTRALRGFTPSRFEGHDFVASPLPPARTLAWCLDRRGCLTTGGVALPYQGEYLVEDVTFDGTPPVQAWSPPPRPPEVGDDELWIDVDRAAQVLTVARGDTPVLATLVSTGLGVRHRTPAGLVRVTDKRLANDMRSRAGSSEPYAVEAVPWVVHIRPRIAIHAAFWHGRYGSPMSHGCINLSPADARAVFGLVAPALPDGWQAVYATDADPGTWVQVR